MHKLIYLLIPFLFLSCKSDAQLAMERGIQFYDWNKFDEALVEFNKVKYLLEDTNNSYLSNIELLAQAHFNLGITYAKLNFLNQAEQEILNALSLVPNQEYRTVLNLVRDKQEQNEVDKP